jgi:hypothetical protein
MVLANAGALKATPKGRHSQRYAVKHAAYYKVWEVADDFPTALLFR